MDGNMKVISASFILGCLSACRNLNGPLIPSEDIYHLGLQLKMIKGNRIAINFHYA